MKSVLGQLPASCTFHFADLTEPWWRRKLIRVNCRSQRMQALQECWRGRIQKLVADTINAPLSYRVQVGPTAITNNFLQRHPITGSAPGCNQDVGVFCFDFFRLTLNAG